MVRNDALQTKFEMTQDDLKCFMILTSKNSLKIALGECISVLENDDGKVFVGKVIK